MNKYAQLTLVVFGFFISVILVIGVLALTEVLDDTTPTATTEVAQEPTETPTPTPEPTLIPPVVSNFLPLVDPNFTPQQLNTEQREMYIKLMENLALDSLRIYPPVFEYCGDTYWVGRGIYDYLRALDAPFRETGDPVLLDELYKIWNCLYSGLEWDEYPHWNFNTLCDGICGADFVAVQDSLAWSGFAHATYIMWVNRQYDVRYYDAAVNGVRVLELMIEAQADREKPVITYLVEKYPGQHNPLDYKQDKNLFHCVAARALGYWYLYLMTDNSRYAHTVTERLDLLLEEIHYQDNGTVLIDHRVQNLWIGSEYGVHPTDYFLASSSYLAYLKLEGVEHPLLSDESIRAIARTYYNVINLYDGNNFYDMDGTGGPPGVAFAISNPIMADFYAASLNVVQNLRQETDVQSRSPHVEATLLYLLRTKESAFVLPRRAQIEATAHLELYENGTKRVFVEQIQTPTPTPTAAPQPTSAPPTATSEVEPSPTPETGTPIPEPSATLHPTPTPDGCYGEVLVNLSIRSGPSVTSSRIGQWNAGEIVRIIEVRYGGDDEWVYAFGARDREGWSAALYFGEDYIRFDVSEECLLVRFPLVHGPHTIVGSGWDRIGPYFGMFGTAKDTTGSNIAQTMELFYSENVSFFRYLPDRPNNWYDGASWVAYLDENAWPSGYDVYEIINEQDAPNGSWYLFAEFHIQAIQEANRRDKRLALFSFATGHFPLDEGLLEIARVMRYARDHPAPSGPHVVAVHQPGYMPEEYCPARGCGWINDPWLAGADEKVCDLLGDLCYDLSWAITEAGFATDPYHDGLNDCEAVAIGMKTSLERWRERPYIKYILWWNFGSVEGWVDYTHCLPTIQRILNG